MVGEKHAMEAKNQELRKVLVEQHKAEKQKLVEKIQELEAQKVVAQSDKRAVEEQMEAVHQEVELAKQEINEEMYPSVDSHLVSFHSNLLLEY